VAGRLLAVMRDVLRVEMPRSLRLPAGLFAACGVLVGWAGYATGCLLGAGDGARRRMDIELERAGHLRAGDRPIRSA
jgi:hypothetical protein